MSCAINYEGELNEKTGMAMGGLGTGTLTLDHAGRFKEIRVQNNWHGNTYKWKKTNFLSIFVAPSGNPSAGKMLQLESGGNLPCVEALTYSGEFPFTRITYQDKELPGELSLEAFSPFVPHDAEASSYPLVFFELKLKNTYSQKISVAAAFSWQNDIALEPWERGLRPQGNYNELLQGDYPGVLMRTLAPNLEKAEYCLCAIPSNGVKYRCVADWWQLKNMQCEPDFDEGRNGAEFKYLYDEDGALSDWRTFLETGNLPKQRTSYDGLGKYSYHCPVGAVSGQTELNPGEERQIKFALIWFFPGHYDCTRTFIGRISAQPKHPCIFS